MKALKPYDDLQKASESNTGSNSRSEVFGEEEQLSNKILVHKVPTDIATLDFREALSKTY